MKCVICKKEYLGKGNSAMPIKYGKNCRCCDDCNRKIVIPARLFITKRIDEMKNCSIDLRKEVIKDEGILI